MSTVRLYSFTAFWKPEVIRGTFVFLPVEILLYKLQATSCNLLLKFPVFTCFSTHFHQVQVPLCFYFLPPFLFIYYIISLLTCHLCLPVNAVSRPNSFRIGSQ
ncbi:hypothetical protein XELAEV_18000629mg [Xenopus laevis]|nr:hypothetical protein XELAEV_18000629mg [Xenopus laevis]